ncbi:UNVERIFIED_CONTAM: hypothetical protein H355_002562 [Colinus virginianus]|nr:hypothetical protein H355_002562 [Colinus virginianus]
MSGVKGQLMLQVRRHECAELQLCLKSSSVYWVAALLSSRKLSTVISGLPLFFIVSKWINSEFTSAQSSLSSRVCHCAGMLSAHAIATALRYWFHGSPPGEIVSMGVLSAGQFCIPEGIVFSMPVRFQNGTWEVVTELEINEKTQEVLGSLSYGLIQVRFCASDSMPIVPPMGTLQYNSEC